MCDHCLITEEQEAERCAFALIWVALRSVCRALCTWGGVIMQPSHNPGHWRTWQIAGRLQRQRKGHGATEAGPPHHELLAPWDAQVTGAQVVDQG